MNIVFCEPIGVSREMLENQKQRFEGAGHSFTYYYDRNENEETLIERIANAHIMTISNIPVSRRIIESCPNLKMINVAFTGIDHINIEACNEHNIKIYNAAGYATAAVSELALGMAINLLRNIAEMDNNTRHLQDRNNFLGEELRGKTVGIVGAGAIGIATGKLFDAFGCHVIAYSQTPKDLPYISFVSLETLFQTSDIISLHLPATAETSLMINKTLLSMMRPSAIIINTARGTIIDNATLAQLLIDKKISGAAIDVYECEPPIAHDHPLLTAPNTILLPHIAYATREAMAKRFQIVIENIWNYINLSESV